MLYYTLYLKLGSRCWTRWVETLLPELQVPKGVGWGGEQLPVCLQLFLWMLLLGCLSLCQYFSQAHFPEMLPPPVLVIKGLPAYQG